jgi:hypothetical protein
VTTSARSRQADSRASSAFTDTAELPAVGGHGQAGRRWSVRLDDEINRRSAYWVAAVLAFYWVLQALWHPPSGVILLGAVVGGLYAMIALGVALVYRANRFINFAQGDMGGAPAALTVLLISTLHWP